MSSLYGRPPVASRMMPARMTGVMASRRRIWPSPGSTLHSRTVSGTLTSRVGATWTTGVKVRV